MAQLILTSLFVFIVLLGYSQDKYIEKGDKHFNNGDYLFAERYYEKAIKKNPDSAVFSKLIVCYNKQGKSSKIGNLYKKMGIEIDNKYFYKYSQYLTSKNKYSEALNYLEKYITKYPGDSSAYYLKSFLKTIEKDTSVLCKENNSHKYCAQFVASQESQDEGEFTYYWKFEDGTTQTGFHIKKCYDTPGIKKVILSVRDNISAKTLMDADTVTVHFRPNGSFNINSQSEVYNTYEPLEFQANSESSDIIYIWDFGDHSIQTGSTIIHNYKSASRHVVRLYFFNPEQNKITGCVYQPITVYYSLD